MTMGNVKNSADERAVLEPESATTAGSESASWALSDRFPARKIHPVLQFCLLMIPVVMNGFFLVYSLTGLLLQGRDLRNWSLEAPAVAIRVGAGIAVFSIVVMLFGWWRRMGAKHVLMLSSVFHLILALILTLAVLIIVGRGS